MKVEGISNYYAFMYNRNTGKITSDNEIDDGFADFYNSGMVSEKDGIANPGYNARKSGIDSLIRFFSTPGTEDDFFNSVSGSDECTIIEEKISDAETRYYVDGKLMFTSLAGDITTNIKFAPDSAEDTEEKLEFNDVSKISISDMDEEEHASPKRKSGTYTQVIVYPDGSRWLITTMYLCGKEIKITKKLPSVDMKDEKEDSLLRQDDEEKDDKPGIADTEELGINQSLEDVIQSYMADDEDLDKNLMLFDDREKEKDK
ncbi:MAG: hypothetical protein HFH68_09380 [Lachnospiraceae bacterium]|nr:hypothetical protein [Lachnospiraceae bacterium]